MRCLGLDLSLHAGWAFGDKGQTPMAGTWTLPGFDDANLDRTMSSIESSVRAIVRAEGIERVAIEAPLMLKGKLAHGTRSLMMLSGAAGAGAWSGGARWIKRPAPNTWRKAVLGQGFPDKPKEAALAYCAMMGWKITEHDAAEAALLFHWASTQLR